MAQTRLVFDEQQLDRRGNDGGHDSDVTVVRAALRLLGFCCGEAHWRPRALASVTAESSLFEKHQPPQLASTRWLALGTLALSISLGCSSSTQDAVATGVPGAAGATSAEDDTLPTSLEFEVQGQVLARETVTLEVRAVPARVYRVRFALPPSGGDPLDAVLNRAESISGANGIATVRLTAPSTSARFHVRASVGSVAASLAVDVVDPGSLTVQVQPRYTTLLRDVTTWTASAHLKTSCADLPGIPPPDGDLTALPSAKSEAPLIHGVPADTPLAITLRSGHFLGGCTSIEALASSPADAPRLVYVSVLNRPIDLAASKLSLSLGLSAPEATWSDALAAAGLAALSTLEGSSLDDADALLDAMRDSRGNQRLEFQAMRKNGSWDQALRAYWGKASGRKLRDAVSSWLGAGRLRFAAAPQLLSAQLLPTPQADSLGEPRAQLQVLSAAGLKATEAGFITPAAVSWSASPDDSVVISSEIYVVLSRLAAGLAEASAIENRTDLGSAVDALAEVANCAGLGAALAAAGSNPASAFAPCDADCLESACQAGLTAIWLRLANATALTPARLSVSATGNARVSDAAAIAGMAGMWLGELKVEGEGRPTGGALTAIAAAP